MAIYFISNYVSLLYMHMLAAKYVSPRDTGTEDMLKEARQKTPKLSTFPTGDMRACPGRITLSIALVITMHIGSRGERHIWTSV